VRASGNRRKHVCCSSAHRHQAREIDNLWDRLSRAYAVFRGESSSELIQEEMQEIRLLEGRSQIGAAR
jgi:hypothetical protein